MIKSQWLISAVFFALVAAVILVPNLLQSGVAPKPATFASEGSTTTLASAITQGQAEGKPVLALTTADWCPPCQALKRGALADPAVQAWIEQNTVPVYVDATNPDSQGGQDAQTLGVRSLPTLAMLQPNGEIAHKLTGNASPAELLRWFESLNVATP